LYLTMSYHFVVGANNLDLKFDLSGPGNDFDDEEGLEGGGLGTGGGGGVGGGKSGGALASSAVSTDNLRDAAGGVGGGGGMHSSATAAGAGAGAATSTNSLDAAMHPLMKEGHAFVDLDSEPLVLGSAEVPVPYSVYPLIGARTDFTPHPCDIVVSYEDLSFCIEIVQDFLDLDSEDDDTAAASGGINGPIDKRKSKSDDDNDSVVAEEKDAPFSIFSVLSASGVRIMVVDNVLGLHLPLVQVNKFFSECFVVGYFYKNILFPFLRIPLII
jgi:hypothetical protein